MTAVAPRVLVADGSTTVRHVLRRLLEEDAGIAVVGEAPDGVALAGLCRDIAHDVLLVDLALPGFEAATTRGCVSPIIVVTAIRTDREARSTAYRAVADRVAGVYAKPGDPDGWRALGRELAATVVALTRPRAAETGTAAARTGGAAEAGLQVVGIGASAGGPHALRELLVAMGSRSRARVAVVQHIAAGFETGLADWLAAETGLDVRVATVGGPFDPGSVRIAPSDRHLVVTPGLELRLDDAPAVAGHRPSVSVLFRSLRALPERSVVAVLLSGMGDDGVDEMLELYRAGARTLVQRRSTCAVPGMPRAALERGAAVVELPASEIGRTLRSAAPPDGRA